MTETRFKLQKAPIIEAVIDIDCDMPPDFDFSKLESPSRDAFQTTYPIFETQFVHEHRIEPVQGGVPKVSQRHGIQAFRCFSSDKKQLIQVRAQGYSFNRLAPYSTLDDYYPEIKRTWELFQSIGGPLQTRAVRLRYINRVPIPFSGTNVALSEYFKAGIDSPEDTELVLTGFLNQRSAVELATGNQINVVIAGEKAEQSVAPVIFDITVAKPIATEPANWIELSKVIESLRNLKNRIFRNTLTDKCLKLFQQ
jgi:uncharacterized protein (TIGR04255 family)